MGSCSSYKQEFGTFTELSCNLILPNPPLFSEIIPALHAELYPNVLLIFSFYPSWDFPQCSLSVYFHLDVYFTESLDEHNGSDPRNISMELEDLKWNVGHAKGPRYTAVAQGLKISLQVT